MTENAKKCMEKVSADIMDEEQPCSKLRESDRESQALTDQEAEKVNGGSVAGPLFWKCTKCGIKNPFTNDRCSSCGSPHRVHG